MFRGLWSLKYTFSIKKYGYSLKVFRIFERKSVIEKSLDFNSKSFLIKYTPSKVQGALDLNTLFLNYEQKLNDIEN